MATDAITGTRANAGLTTGRVGGGCGGGGGKLYPRHCRDFPETSKIKDDLRNIPVSKRKKVTLLGPEDISGMEECKIPVSTKNKMILH